LGKLLTSDEGFFLKSLWLTLATYLMSGLAGLALFVQGKTEFPHNAIWKQLSNFLPGVIRVPDSSILPWVAIGDWFGNVYSGLAYWLDAFGVLGTLIYIAILSALARQIFSRVGLSWIFLQRLFFFSIMMSFHQDFFLASAQVWIGFSICAILIGLFVIESDSPRSFLGSGKVF
jgi:hypothetical protein